MGWIPYSLETLKRFEQKHLKHYPSATGTKADVQQQADPPAITGMETNCKV